MKVFQMPHRRLLTALAASSLLIAGSFAAEVPNSKFGTAVSGMMQYLSPEGETYSVLMLPSPQRPAKSASARDIVMLLDTSASQTGEYQSKTVNLVREIAGKLPASDRIHLIAVDVTQESLTSGFVGTESQELRQGLNRLNDRIPLGSTDLGSAIKFGLKSFSGDRSRVMVYIGDGFSTAQLIQTEVMSSLIQDLRKARIPVNCLAIGPRIDLVTLGTLAQQTGGLIVTDRPQVVASTGSTTSTTIRQAEQMAQAVMSPVFYPEKLTSSPLIPQTLSGGLPPVRFDRETVILAKGVEATQIQVKMSGQLLGQSHEQSWTIKLEPTISSTRFIEQAWQFGLVTNGVALPWAGREMVQLSQETHLTQIENLSESAVKSLNQKKYSEAQELSRTLIQIDPNNSDARQVLLRASQGLRVKPVKGGKQVALAFQEEEKPEEEKPAATTEAPATNENPTPEATTTTDPQATTETPAPVEGVEEESNPKTDSILDELEAKRKVREEQLTIDTNTTIDDSGRLAEDDYEAAREMLKRIQNSVTADTSISTDVRRALLKRLDNALTSLQNENEKRVQIRIEKQREISANEARKKLADEARRNEEKMEQLIDRVRALLVRGYKGDEYAFEDAEQVARTAVEIDPYLGVPNLAVFNAEAAGQLDKARRLRNLRQDKLLAVLHQVELSHVPFPDEPPVLWPSPERWQWITENRRKWKSVDLKTYSKKEEKIVRELDKPTTFDFTDESLDGVVDTIKERHGFDIVIDKTKLEEESIATDATDITLKVNEITLKNALKLLLDGKNLTYVVENEVMKITTKTGDVKRPLRVYNVGDLVMPVNPLFGSGGSGIGGQSGGGGQFNSSGGGGQFGGGANGFGGGGFGGGGFGGGGGGGGFFNVPLPKDPGEILNQGIQQNGIQPIQPQPVKPVQQKKVSQAKATGQVFAQVVDQPENRNVLNAETLKNRKKKPIMMR